MTSENATGAPLRVGDAGFFEAIVRTSVDPFVVIDADFVLRYASPSIELLLGWAPDDWLGRTIAELLEPESLDVAIQGVNELHQVPAEPDWVGAPVRLQLSTAWGEIIPVDALARETARTGVEGYVVQLHRAAASQALSDAVDTILEGEDLDRALLQLTALIEHDITRTIATLGSNWDGTRFHQIAGDHGLLRLDAPRTTDTEAIRSALGSAREVSDIFDRLDPETQAAARARGMHACWCAPVAGEDVTAALFIWHTEAILPGAIYRVDIRRAVNLTRLALQWSSQQRRLAWEVSHDQLTGLTNRSEFQNRLDASSGHARAVLFCDLDDFKPVNERFGHRVGDRVLEAVSGRFDGVSRGSVVARIGGDEFAILLEPVEAVEVALAVAERVRDSLVTPIAVDHRRVHVGVTIGVAFDPSGAAPSDRLMDEADRLLLAGKASGKNQVLSVTLED